jgi:gamma-glutamyltranspeptidase/glutathione hydrolase
MAYPRRIPPILGALSFALLALVLTGTDTPDAPNRGAYERFAVASDHPLASNAGLEVLREGGNAADAAAATMLALGVVNPQSSGMGGGGFALYYDAESGELTFLDFRERAPGGATPDMYEDNEAQGGPASKKSQLGGLAAGVPGEPAGIAELVRRFGDKPLSVAAAPATRLASEGFEAREALSRMSIAFAEHLRRDPVMRGWIADGEEGITVGQRLRQQQLARTLREFGARGAPAIYRGRVARAIVAASRRNGGIITLEDLADYAVVEREPLSANLLGHRWVTAPPPSAGGYTMLASLALLDRWIPEARREEGGAPLFHALAESWKGPFWDRASYFGDPDYVDVPIDALLGDERIARRAEVYRRQVATHADLYALPLPDTPAGPPSPPEEHGTSHLCVVDEEGNVAAVTTTVNLPFGARFTAAGIVMNDEMDDFASAVGEANAFGLPGGAPNLPGPGHRPVSTMSPTIVLDGDGPVLCIGASGGSRIVTATEQVAWHTLVRGLDPYDALNHPRVHHQGYPNTLRIEETNPQPEAVVEGLRARGHDIEVHRHSAVVQLVRIQRDGEPRLIAVSDPRKGGQPAGE